MQLMFQLFSGTPVFSCTPTDKNLEGLGLKTWWLESQQNVITLEVYS
jgi:hypothetical protein